jgi:hypothetical protein
MVSFTSLDTTVVLSLGVEVLVSCTVGHEMHEIGMYTIEFLLSTTDFLHKRLGYRYHL